MRLTRLTLLIFVAATTISTAHAQQQVPTAAPRAGNDTIDPGERDAFAVEVSEFELLNTVEIDDTPVANASCSCGSSKKKSNCCDCKKRKELRAKAAGSHKGVFFENDFSYLNDCCYDDWLLGDCLKQRQVGPATVDIGGQYRARHHSERNHRGLGLTGVDDDFLLHRTRLYADAKFGSRFRVYGEYIDAESNYENFAPRPIEVNRSDVLNLFGDAMLYDDCRGQLWARVGRQELAYGTQRLISPLDWSNTRRKFDGYKVFWKGADWDVDAFYTRPVAVDPKKFDTPLYDEEFMGVYATYKGRKGHTQDFYYLRYNDGTGTNSFKYDTVGARWQGSTGNLLFEAEGAYQFGENTDGSNHSAGMFTLGLGREYTTATWQPAVWVYYDWASGSDTEGNGFHHLFPLAHKYNGLMDLFGRRNLEDFNVLVSVKPHKKVKLLAWWHLFNLQNGNDIPYNVVMGQSPFVPPAPGIVTPGGSQHLGHELDLLASFTLTPRADLTFGYSHFWAGTWFSTNPSPLPFRDDADFFYTQFTVDF